MLVPSYLGGDCSILLSYGDAVVSIPRRVIERKKLFIETEVDTRIRVRDPGPPVIRATELLLGQVGV